MDRALRTTCSQPLGGTDRSNRRSSSRPPVPKVRNPDELVGKWSEQRQRRLGDRGTAGAAEAAGVAKTRRTPVKCNDRQEEDQESCVGTNAFRPAQELGSGIFPQHGQVVIELVTKVDGETEVRNGERERLK